MRKNWLFGALVSFAVVSIGLCIGEGLLRLIDHRPELLNERNTLYQYDSELGWFPKPLYRGTYFYEPNQPIQIQHNAMGFRDIEHGPKNRPVLAIVGDSYVYGFNVKQSERFTDLLRDKMPYEIYNLGVSGFGTDQEYLLLKRVFKQIHPDVVLLIFCGNDHDDNSTNRRYGYYKPYFTLGGAGVPELHGIPVPKALLYYPATYPRLFRSMIVIRAAEMIWRPIAKRFWPTIHVPDPSEALLRMMRDETERNGAKFMVGFIGFGAQEKALCSRVHLDCFETDSKHVYTTPGGHWNAEGHRDVADQVERHFRERKDLR
jgi:hypothetical protein